jgi:hypothetical protein
MGFACVLDGVTRNAYRILTVKPLGKYQHETPTSREDYNIKTHLRGIDGEVGGK